MHEFASVDSFVFAVLHEIDRRGLGPIRTVRARRSASFVDEAVRQVFEYLTRGTKLENVRLELEASVPHVHCTCGHEQVLGENDIAGIPVECQSCGAVVQTHPQPDLELLELVEKGRHAHR